MWIMARRRSLSTALPAQFASLPCWPFPLNGDRPHQSRLFMLRVTRERGKDKTMSNTNEKQDVYTRITDRIIAALEQGVRPWIQPWNAEHAAGKITRPL